jgi:hypothetical protein
MNVFPKADRALLIGVGEEVGWGVAELLVRHNPAR